MDSELQTLESKVAQVAEVCRTLREENDQLRARAASLESENQALTRRMDEARQRIDGLIDKLPAE